MLDKGGRLAAFVAFNQPLGFIVAMLWSSLPNAMATDNYEMIGFSCPVDHVFIAQFGQLGK